MNKHRTKHWHTQTDTKRLQRNFCSLHDIGQFFIVRHREPLTFKMAKKLKNTKFANKNRSRVSYHRDWNKILVSELIRDQTSSIVNNQNQMPCQLNSQDDKQPSTREQLRRWALKYNISKRAVTDLLKILISYGLIWLPKDSRTLLQTQRRVELSTLDNGKLW